jgi:hypothetical protein
VKFKIDKCVIQEWLHLQWLIILQIYPSITITKRARNWNNLNFGGLGLNLSHTSKMGTKETWLVPIIVNENTKFGIKDKLTKSNGEGHKPISSIQSS